MVVLQDLTDTGEGLETLADFFRTGALEISLTVAVALGVTAVLVWRWWAIGRDRWFGDTYAVPPDSGAQAKPLLAHETVVVAYTPPELPDKNRVLRPAEVGLLLEERVDETALSATIVDLAVRGYIQIEEMEPRNLLRRGDVGLTKTRRLDDGLLAFERELMRSLFGRRRSVRLSDLRGGFYLGRARLAFALYEEAVRSGLLAENPHVVRETYRVAAALIAAGGVAGAGLLGWTLGLGLVAVPVVLGGLVLLAVADAMPRRTGLGRQLYQRCLGFREYVATAEVDRQRFAEERGMFEEYLPYAIIFRCTERWAGAFRGLGSMDATADYHFGSTGLLPLDLAIGLGEIVASLPRRRRRGRQRKREPLFQHET